MIHSLKQIGINVKDLSRAVAFYEDILEMNTLFQMESMAFVQCKEILLHLSLPEKEQFDHPSSVLYFSVKDVQSSYQRLRKKGVKIIDKPHVVSRTNTIETWMFFFYDSEENIHALVEDVKTKEQ